VLAAEWTLAGCWAELTSEDEEARLQSGVAKLREKIARLKKWCLRRADGGSEQDR